MNNARKNNPNYKDELMYQLADKYNVGVGEIRLAVNSQFRFARNKMEEGHDVRLPFFGIFKKNKKKEKKVNEVITERKRIKDQGGS